MLINTNIICTQCNLQELQAYGTLNDMDIFWCTSILCSNCGKNPKHTFRTLKSVVYFCENYDRHNLTESQMAVNVFCKKIYDGKMIEMNLSTSRKGDWANYVAPFLTIIKQMIPINHREFDDATKTWTIDANYLLGIEMGVKSLSPNVILHWVVNVVKDDPLKNVKVDEKFAEDFFYEEPASVNAPSRDSIKDKLEVLLEVKITTQSIEELKKIYRQKAMQLHPDRNGGDSSKMSELNSLWSVYIK